LLMDRANDIVLLLGRLLMAALFLPSAISKLLGFSGFAASLATKGLPYPEAWAAAAVAIEILGPIALILGFLPRLTALLLVAFVVMASGTSHRYWEFTEAPARRAQEISFYKNVDIIAGLLFYFASGPGAWSLAGWKSTEAAPPQSA
jgi:putative oxidoreductase